MSMSPNWLRSMDSFLHHIARQYPVELPETLKDTCFVFPSRRASLYFTNILKQQNKDIAFWAPATFSIEEFVIEHNPGLLVEEPLQLILKLFEVYRQHGGREDFDEFYSWGSVLLNDFDEIDRNLVEGRLVYKNLQEVDDLEATFGPSEEMIQALKGFKKVIDDGQDGLLTRNFIENWARIGNIYEQFRESLLTSGKSYIGLLYSLLAKNISSGDQVLKYDKVVFAGFNALSKAEEVIINTLLEQGRAKVFFDADHYYLKDDQEEAGTFLRRHQRRWYRHPEVKWVISDGFNLEKNITVIGVEQKTSQTRMVSEIIDQYGLDKTAVVMGDETLIAPMLYSLPATMGNVNITMGYPVASSGLAELCRAYFRYQQGISPGKDKVYVNRQAVVELLSQPSLGTFELGFLKSIRSGRSNYLLLDHLQEALAQMPKDDHALLQGLLAPAAETLAALDQLISFLAKEYYVKKETRDNPLLDSGIRHSLIVYLKGLKGQLEISGLTLSYTVLDKILREAFKQLSTPFSGEPLADLQIMGFLESRALDFKNIVLLSVNEDTIPASSGNNSYIPFHIRKAFGLPTFIEQNSIYAYHFFRLLQRAENITLVYSTELSVTGGGEQSRFIYQLEERSRKNTKIHLTRKIWSPEIPAVSTDDLSISVPKTGAVAKQLEEHLNLLSSEKSLAPTQLVDYITCPLKYYYARVLKIREPDLETGNIDARVFGNLLHQVFEECYKDWLGKEITADEIKQLIKNLPKIIEHVFEGYDRDNGETNFTKGVIRNITELILKNDLNDAPIYIYDLESKTYPLKTLLTVSDEIAVNMGGFIDRLDRVNSKDGEVYRVLDYKTGKAELSPISYYRKAVSHADYIETHFNDPKYKSGFQLLFYILLLHKLNPAWQLNGGIVGVRSLNSGIDYLRKSPGPIAPEIIDLFESRLKRLILEIANKEIPFTQTEEIKRCEYCQFRRICNR